MYAIVKTGGKQYKVAAGDTLRVERLAGDKGSTVELTDVLMVTTDKDVKVGKPTVSLQRDARAGCAVAGEKRTQVHLVLPGGAPHLLVQLALQLDQ